MQFAIDHPFVTAALVALVAGVVAWRVVCAALRALRLFIRSLWPH